MATGNDPANQTASETLARFAAAFSLEELDPEILAAARVAVLDSIGCGIAGAHDVALNRLVRTAQDSGESGACHIFGRSERFCPRAAALANGTMIHALEMDDTHSFSSVHAGGPVLAAALSAVFIRQSTADRFFEAIVSGYEVACRLGMAIRGRNPYLRGFHPTGICGVFGAATAGSKILGLDTRGFLNAWGIAASMAGGLMAYLQNGAWTKKLHSGWAAQSGFMAALLAREGYLAPPDIFQGKYNFCNAYADSFDESALVQELGTRFEINRMSFKKFACCRTIHAPITAAIELRSRPEFNPEKIEQIQAFIADEDLDLVVEPLAKTMHPKTQVEAQFSMPFGVALALTHGDASSDDYTQEKMENQLIRDLATKFSYFVKDEFTRRRPSQFPCELRVNVAGKWLRASVEAPLGDYTNPLSTSQLKEKFRKLTRPIIGSRQARLLENCIMKLGGRDRADQITLLAAKTQ
jgi:2-methylcitrate dehydratase PrpD